MKKIFIFSILFVNSIFTFGEYIDNPEYNYLKPFLKEEQQITFNKIIKENEFSLSAINGKINIAKDEKEKKKLEEEKKLIIKEREKLIENLQINILKYPERYTENAINLKEDIKTLVLSYSKVKI